MKTIKTCFFQKISTIELSTQVCLFSNHIQMGRNNTLAAATLAATMTATSPAIQAETPVSQQERITCETQQACQKLTESIQAQIDELKNKGLRNLSKDERKQFVALKKNFIALENQKQEKQIHQMASEDAETLDIAKTSQKIADLRSALLEN